MFNKTLYDAEVTCKLTTGCGEIEWSASEGEEDQHWEWVSDEAINPRILFHSMPEGGGYATGIQNVSKVGAGTIYVSVELSNSKETFGIFQVLM